MKEIKAVNLHQIVATPARVRIQSLSQDFERQNDENATIWFILLTFFMNMTKPISYFMSFILVLHEIEALDEHDEYHHKMRSS